jgi:tRNA pseudouridine55 synthase
MSRRGSAGGPHGIVVVDKPCGPTSHDVVQQARRVFHTRRVGHAGTLDPMATGVLVLLLGEATKLSEIATAADKTYRAGVYFGRATDSYDADGSTTAESSVTLEQIADVDLERALQAERERALQVPPALSAIKLQGRRAYELARSGAAPELEARPIRVRQIEIVARDTHQLTLELRVSKGYYVRSFARDLGAALGVPTHLNELRRLASGSFSIAEALAWPPAKPPEPLPLTQALAQLLPTLRLSDVGVTRARAGQLLSDADFLEDPSMGARTHAGSEPTLCAWVDRNGSPIALGTRGSDGWRVRRGFAAESLDAGGATPKAEP